MKRSLKKLTLNRETIGRLEEQQLVTAVGASGPSCSPTICNTQCFVCPPSLGTNCSFCDSDCDTCKGC